ncbi:MAG TPA: hypothetical protein VJ805_08590 [Nitrospiraceae bacterium]|nr:hypothetical protein [Nitrospiraceae bacterium]
MTIISHGGRTAGFQSGLWFLPDQRIGLIVLTNNGSQSHLAVVARHKLFELILGAKPTAEQVLQSLLATESRALASIKQHVSPTPTTPRG